MPLSTHREAPLMLTGMGGVLGAGLHRGGLNERLAEQDVVIVGRRQPLAWQEHVFREADFAEPGELAALIQELRPRAVFHAAALSRMDQCELQPEFAERLNAGVLEELAGALSPYGGHFVYCSTDQVFDGTAASYAEAAPVSPIHAYGRSKARGEAIALAHDAAVLRLPLLLGPPVPGRLERMGAEAGVIAAARAGRSLSLFTDEWRAPADPASFVAAVAELLLGKPRRGVFHLAGADPVSRFELGELSCAAAGLPSIHQASSLATWTGPPRPPRLVLSCERARRELGFRPPDLRQSLARLCALAGTGLPAKED